MRATLNGVNGYVVRGKGDYSSASIFLPFAGEGYGTSLDYAGLKGCCRSAVPYPDYSRSAWHFFFDLSRHYTGAKLCYYGQSVRPLQGFTK